MASRLLSSLASRGRLLGRLNPIRKQPKRGAAGGPDIFDVAHDQFWKDYCSHYKKMSAIGVFVMPMMIFVSLELEEALDVIRDDYHPYVHMRIRIHPFPFGDGVRSLMHDPYYNAVPGEGYDLDENPYLHHK